MKAAGRRARSALEVLESRLLLDGAAAVDTSWRAGDLLRPDATAEMWGRQNMLVTQAVRLNDLGLARVNAARAAQGLVPLDVPVAARGSEVVGATQAALDAGATGAFGGDATALAAAVATVDNSATIYFPPVRSQGSIRSCAAWATTYYAGTYMTAFARNINVATGGNNVILSPKWSYNMVNGGADNGSNASDIYNLLIKNGAATWTQMPYDSNYTAWIYNNPAVWRSAVGYRMDQTGTVNGVDTDTGLSQLKTLLTDGYVLNYGCDIYGWHGTTVKNDPATADDDAYAGQYAVSWASTDNSGHEMTVVGFNDAIWIDVNGNGVVDAGEKGALKIVNSWGTGYGTNGFAWVSYDALKATSAVAGAPTTNRTGAFWYNQVTWITARASYTPTALAEFTVSTASRNEIRLQLGLADGGNSPTSTWTPSALMQDGGALGFDGVSYTGNPSAAPAGTFVMDFSDLATDLSLPKRYFLGLDDTTNTALAATLSSFKLTDAAGTVLGTCSSGTSLGDLPATDADTYGTYVWGIMDYPPTEIRGAVYSDVNSNGVWDAGEAGVPGATVYVDANGDGALDNACTSFTNTTAAAINNKKTTTSFIYVSGISDNIADVNLTLNITHTRDADLTVYLTSPWGTKLTLFSGVGGSGANFTGTVLDDSAATLISAGTAPFTGSYRPTGALSVFNGHSANGNWRLDIYDGYNYNIGTLNSWSLSIGTAEPQEQTDATGAYRLPRLSAGTYTVRLAPQTGLTQTAPADAYTVTLAAMQVATGNDFGVYTAAPTVATPVVAVPATVTGTSTSLSVLGADDGGEANLTYTWSTLSKPSGAGNPLFSASGTNAAKNTTVTFSKAGSYTLRATITDKGNRSVTSDVTVTVVQTLTSIVLTPASVLMLTGATQQFAATARDQFGQNMSPQPTFAWSIDAGGVGSITSTGLYTASAAGSATVRVSVGAVGATAAVTAQVPSMGLFAAHADVGTFTPAGWANEASGTYIVKGAGSDIWGSSDQFQFIYKTLTGDGDIIAQVTTMDNTNSWAKAGVMFRNTLLADSANAFLAVTPGSGVSYQWRASGAGTTSNSTTSGLVAPYWVKLSRIGNTFAAYRSADGLTWTQQGSTQTIVMNATVYVGLAVTSHASGTLCSATFANVSIPNHAPTIATAAAATPSPVTGTTTSVSVLGSDDNGEANLTYTWSTLSRPAGAPDVTFSAGGTNAAKAATATFHQAGGYVLRATVSDGTLTATSDVSVTVSPTLTAIAAAAPCAGPVPAGVCQQFTATLTDQFGQPMSATVTWAASAGTIDAAGSLTTDATFDGTVSVTASAGGLISAPATLGFVPTRYTGTTGDDTYTFTLDPDGVTLHITAGAATYSIARAAMAPIVLAPGDGNDSLTLDYTYGDPLPTGGASFTGGLQTDTLTVTGTSAGEPFTLGDATLTHAGRTLTYSADSLVLMSGTYTVTGSYVANQLSVGSAATVNLAPPSGWFMVTDLSFLLGGATGCRTPATNTSTTPSTTPPQSTTAGTASAAPTTSTAPASTSTSTPTATTTTTAAMMSTPASRALGSSPRPSGAPAAAVTPPATTPVPAMAPAPAAPPRITVPVVTAHLIAPAAIPPAVAPAHGNALPRHPATPHLAPAAPSRPPAASAASVVQLAPPATPAEAIGLRDYMLRLVRLRRRF